MGMYTELVLKCEIKKDTPPDVIAVLRHLFADDNIPATLPEHEFFKCGAWSRIGSCSSFYHHPRPVNDYNTESSFQAARIFSRSDLKNYDGEIEKFIDWVSPYLDCDEEQCIGWSWYEECDSPMLIYKAKPNKETN
jgi:hypothetical protein